MKFHLILVPKIFIFIFLMIVLPFIIYYTLQQQKLKQNAAGHSNTLVPKPLSSSSVSPLIFGTNLTLNDGNDQFLTSQQTRTLMQQMHVQIIRMPIRSFGGPSTAEVQAMQQIHALGVPPIIILKYSQPDVLGSAKLVIQAANSIFGNSVVYYEFGNERDINGVDQVSYTNTWNQVIAQVKQTALNGKFGGPTNGYPNIPYIAYFVQHASPAPDFVSYHQYTCSSNDSVQQCINNIPSYGTTLQQVINAIGQTGKPVPPIMLTEWNYDSTPPNPDPRLTTQFEQQYTQAVFTEFAKDNFFAITHYVVTGSGVYQLIDATPQLTAQGQTFEQMYQQLIGNGNGISLTPTPVPSVTVLPTKTITPSVPVTPTAGVTGSGTPGVSPTDTPTPTGFLSPTPTPSVAPTPTQTPSPTPGPAIGIITVHFEGIDPANIPTPHHPQRQLILSFFSSQDFSHQPLAIIPEIVTFSPNDPNGAFINNNIDLSFLPQGSYYVLVKSPEGSLQELLNNSQPLFITRGKTIALTGSSVPITLRMGDLDNSNTVDLKDYNILIDCFATKVTSTTCKKHIISDHFLPTFADINDDGQVSGVDYNILIRHFGDQGYGSVPATHLSQINPSLFSPRITITPSTTLSTTSPTP